MPGIIDKLGDNKVVVRQANIRLLDELMQVLPPGVVLDAFLPALSHGNLKIREQAVNTITQVPTLKHHVASAEPVLRLMSSMPFLAVYIVTHACTPACTMFTYCPITDRSGMALDITLSCAYTAAYTNLCFNAAICLIGVFSAAS